MKSAKIAMKIFFKNAIFCEVPWKYLQILQKSLTEIIAKHCEWSGAKDYQSDRSRQELSNEYLVAKIGFDTAENEPLKVWITDHTFDHISSLL